MLFRSEFTVFIQEPLTLKFTLLYVVQKFITVKKVITKEYYNYSFFKPKQYSKANFNVKSSCIVTVFITK